MDKKPENESSLLDEAYDNINQFYLITQKIKEASEKILDFSNDLYRKNSQKLIIPNDFYSYTEGYLMFDKYKILVRVWDSKDLISDDCVLFDFPIYCGQNNFTINTKINKNHLSKSFKETFSWNTQQIINEKIKMDFYTSFKKNESEEIISAIMNDTNDIITINCLLDDFGKSQTYKMIQKYKEQMWLIIKMLMVFYNQTLSLSSKYVNIDYFCEQG